MHFNSEVVIIFLRNTMQCNAVTFTEASEQYLMRNSYVVNNRQTVLPR